jgi:4a-hydroxytetrahydrobiopterin dehydratase
MSQDLTHRRCTPCHASTPALRGVALEEHAERLADRWAVVDDHHLTAEFSFSDFRAALDFTNRVGRLAEAEGHHPEITLGWGRVTLRIWTHAIDALSENDFILAAKIEALST